MAVISTTNMLHIGEGRTIYRLANGKLGFIREKSRPRLQQQEVRLLAQSWLDFIHRDFIFKFNSALRIVQVVAGFAVVHTADGLPTVGVVALCRFFEVIIPGMAGAFPPIKKTPPMPLFRGKEA